METIETIISKIKSMSDSFLNIKTGFIERLAFDDAVKNKVKPNGNFTLSEDLEIINPFKIIVSKLAGKRTILDDELKKLEDEKDIVITKFYPDEVGKIEDKKNLIKPEITNKEKDISGNDKTIEQILDRAERKGISIKTRNSKVNKSFPLKKREKQFFNKNVITDFSIKIVLIILEAVLFYTVLHQTHDDKEILLRSIVFIPIIFIASFLTGKKSNITGEIVKYTSIVAMYAILFFTILEFYHDLRVNDVSLTFSDFFIKYSFLIIGATIVITLAIFITSILNSIRARKLITSSSDDLIETTINDEGLETLKLQNDYETHMDKKVRLCEQLSDLKDKLSDIDKEKEILDKTVKEKLEKIIKRTDEILNTELKLVNEKIEQVKLKAWDLIKCYRKEFEYIADFSPVWKTPVF